MATRKEEPSSGAHERPPQQASESGDPGSERLSKGSNRGNEEGIEPQSADEGLRQVVNWGRRATDIAAEHARRQSEQAAELSAKSLRGITDVSRGDVDAVLQSSTRLARGIQEMTLEFNNVTQQSLRRSMQLANDLLHCRSLEDLVATQRDYLRETMEVVVSGSTRLMSLSGRLANDAVAPLSERAVKSGQDIAENLEQQRETISQNLRRSSDPSRDVRH